MSVRGLAGVVVAAVAAVLLPVAAATPADATPYRYWTYWHGTPGGGWTFSSVGATYVPPGSSVDGWRFGVSTVAGSIKPRTASSFTGICGGRAPAAGHKLVGLVVDYGTSADAPAGQHPPAGIDTFCADVVTGANAYQVLSAYSSVRSAGGLVCGIGGYPVGECGVPVTPTPRPTARPTHSTPPPTHHTSPTATRAAVVTSAAATHPTPSAAVPPATAASTASTPPTSGQPADSSPTVVAVGSAGRAPVDDGSGGAPAGALAGATLVAVVGGAAALRAWRARAGRHG